MVNARVRTRARTHTHTHTYTHTHTHTHKHTHTHTRTHSQTFSHVPSAQVPSLDSKLNNGFNIRSSPLQNLLHIAEPKYLHRLINIKPPSTTRASDHLCLSLPPVSTRLKFADRSFRNSSLRLWNSLPLNLRSFAPDTHHCTIVIWSTPTHPCRALSLSRNQILSCLKTYLFTLFYTP